MEELILHGQTGGSETDTIRTVVGVDTSKRVFQLYWAESKAGECMGAKLTRAKFFEHFVNRDSCLVAMEACGGSQHWARQLLELGHELRLIPAKKVRPFVGGNQNDAQDARAIWTAVQQPGLRPVAIKSEEQHAVLALHRMRAQLVKFRTAQINARRGLLAEYGEVRAQGRSGIRRAIAEALERVSERLPAMVIETLREPWARVAELDAQVGEIERRLRQWQRGEPAYRGGPGRWSARRHRGGRHDERPECVHVRARVRRLAGAGAPAP